MTLTYECIIWTDFIQHQNKIVEDINYASDSYWGKQNAFKFLATLDSFDIQNDLTQGSDRMSKANFTLNMSGYIIPDNLQKDMTQFNKTHYGVAEVNLFTTDVTVVNDLNQAYDKNGKTKKFTDEELKTISEIKQIYDNTTLRIGQLHFEEKQLLNERAELERMFNNNREKEIKFAQELNDKYGKGTLDIETGIFTPVE